jgi:fimbrial chaperone protein
MPLPRLALAALTCALLATAAHAISISPVDIEMTASGAHARAQFTVTNDGAGPMPLEITVNTLVYGEDGKEKMAEGGDNILVTPAATIIPPGARQIFRVQWVGTPDLASSESFMILANQLPVRDKSGKSSVQVVAGLGAILNVAPAGGVPKLKLVSVAPAKTAKGGPAAAILVENPSNTHALIANSTLTIGGETVPPTSMQAQVGIGVVGPGKRRKFLVPLENPVAAGAKANITVKAAR